MAEALAWIDDIFFGAKVTETAKHAGISLQTCASLEALAAAIAAGRPNLLVVDLNAGADAFQAIALARKEAPGLPIVAFLSHVQTELAERARAAGVTDVMARSKFTRDLATILSRAKSET